MYFLPSLYILHVILCVIVILCGSVNFMSDIFATILMDLQELRQQVRMIKLRLIFFPQTGTFNEIFYVYADVYIIFMHMTCVIM